MNSLAHALEAALHTSLLTDSARSNILQFLNRPDSETWERLSITELAEAEQWTELNDRFYRSLEFGTGGLRGRTIARHVTLAEQGAGTAEVPEHPAAGTNTMNCYMVAIATRGLLAYIHQRFPNEPPRVAIAYDTRHFSRQFAALAAEIVAGQGGSAYLFTEPSPTPQLSFAVRHFHAHAGIVLTASHNPSHDNGYKVYFADGAQITEPHASSIIAAVKAVQHLPAPAGCSETGSVVPIGPEFDDIYIAALGNLILCPDVFDRGGPPLRIVYTPLHGTGLKIVPRILRGLGVDVIVVEEQATPDGRFPTVASPNPENKDALSLAVARAKATGAVAVFATDPDCDRLAIAVRNAEGEYECLSGNQTGALLADYRLEQLFRLGILDDGNRGHAAVIKTFVTTDLLRSIAASYGVKCIDTLTGFKYIGAKLREYEEAAGGRGDLTPAAWRRKLLAVSTYCVFAGEESLGYLAEDHVRDKDAAGSAVMLAEVLASAARDHSSGLEILDRVYRQHGYYSDYLGTLTFEGGAGARKIAALLASYEADPPQRWADLKVLGIQNFSTHDIFDEDGTRLPRELMLIFRLADTCSVTIRASGTEPKIKFYFSAQAPVAAPQALALAKERVGRTLEQLWAFAKADVEARLARAFQH